MIVYEFGMNVVGGLCYVSFLNVGFVSYGVGVSRVLGR